MKFDALLFHYWRTGPSPSVLLGEIADAMPTEMLGAPPSAPPSSMNWSEADTRSTYSRRCRASEREMDEWIQATLRHRACHAFDWFGHSMLVARAGEHRDLLRRLRAKFSDDFVVEYRDVAAPSTDFRGANFLDYGSEARVCWDLASESDGAVLVLCVFGWHSGNWWRPATADAKPLICRRGTENAGTPVVRAVYRVTSGQTLSTMWSHASENDGIARVCVPATMPPEILYDLPMLLCGCEPELLAVAEAYGWIYTQIYGGGADEHTAMFAARDPALVARVYARVAEHALSDEGWCLMGRF